MVSTTLAECVARSGVEGFHNAGIARRVVGGSDQRGNLTEGLCIGSNSEKVCFLEKDFS